MSKKKDYTNAINFFMRNKYGGYMEVLFSSILSNLLDPEVRFGGHGEVLKALGNKIFNEELELKDGTLDSEFDLGAAGRIDIYFQNPRVELGFEVKINDDSARNDDAGGVPQLIRYAQAIKVRAERSGKRWALMFVPPTAQSSVCAEEFLTALERNPKNLFLWPWKAPVTGHQY